MDGLDFVFAAPAELSVQWVFSHCLTGRQYVVLLYRDKLLGTSS